MFTFTREDLRDATPEQLYAARDDLRGAIQKATERLTKPNASPAEIRFDVRSIERNGQQLAELAAEVQRRQEE